VPADKCGFALYKYLRQNQLQKAGLIDYRHGHITVLGRSGLEARVCECYQVVKTESDRLLPRPGVAH